MKLGTEVDLGYIILHTVTKLRWWSHLRFDFHSTAIRPRYDHSTTDDVTTVQVSVTAASGLRHCDLNDL